MGTLPAGVVQDVVSGVGGHVIAGVSQYPDHGTPGMAPVLSTRAREAADPLPQPCRRRLCLGPDLIYTWLQNSTLTGLSVSMVNITIMDTNASYQFPWKVRVRVRPKCVVGLI